MKTAQSDETAVEPTHNRTKEPIHDHWVGDCWVKNKIKQNKTNKQKNNSKLIIADFGGTIFSPFKFERAPSSIYI